MSTLPPVLYCNCAHRGVPNVGRCTTIANAARAGAVALCVDANRQSTADHATQEDRCGQPLASRRDHLHGQAGSVRNVSFEVRNLTTRKGVFETANAAHRWAGSRSQELMMDRSTGGKRLGNQAQKYYDDKKLNGRSQLSNFLADMKSARLSGRLT